jgi:hypothetical protein
MNDVSLESQEGARISMVARIDSWIEDFSQDEIDAFVLSIGCSSRTTTDFRFVI